MDRIIVYPGAIPLETDILNTNRFAMNAFGKLAKAVFGGNTALFDFPASATVPATLSVNIGAGQIYSLQPVDATAYSSLPADTVDTLVKQGLQWSTKRLSCPAPTTAGFSINYLIEIGYLDVDTQETVLPYYNSSDPAQPFSGPNNSGASQATVRQGVASVQVKSGIPATTGSQSTPSPDAGYVGAYVVTVAYGQTTITANDISVAPGAPFLTPGLVANALTTPSGDLRYGQLNVANTWTQPQTMPNAVAEDQPVTLGQATSAFSPRTLAVALGASSSPTPNQYLAIYSAPVATTFPANFTGSFAQCLAAPTGAIVCNVVTVPNNSNTPTVVGTLSFGAGAFTGVFSASGPVSVPAGSILAIQAPSTSDATWSGIGGTLYGSF
jgi:hypothetical protein